MTEEEAISVMQAESRPKVNPTSQSASRALLFIAIIYSLLNISCWLS